MRHRNKTAKLKRNASQRRALLANLACSLIEHGRIRTTLGKAKALRPLAEKLVTLGKRGDLHARRQAVAFLRHKDVVKKLFDEVAPRSKDRPGGYCRITKLGARMTDAAEMAFIEWVDLPAEDSDELEAAPAAAAEEPAAEASEETAEETPVEETAEEETPAAEAEVTEEEAPAAEAEVAEEEAVDSEETEEEKPKA
ncbi:50S ribosomal protein L17 [Haloferula sp. A504]|uniref:50S ribosomal protein L17 n=1 Tax=Haloferula sp. A504 TaxID=3373601 RepID=UPI003787B301